MSVATNGGVRGGRIAGLTGWNAITLAFVVVHSLAIVILLTKEFQAKVEVKTSAPPATIDHIPRNVHVNRTRTCTTEASECAKQGFNLGPLSTAAECALAVANRKGGCGNTFMFSSKYPGWGCRCCVIDDAPPYPKNPNWALHSISDCCKNMTKECLEKEAGLLKKGIDLLKKDNDRLRDLSTYKTTSEERVSEVYGALREVVETLHKENSTLKDPWFAFAGTLIGVHRSHPPGMMRWDDDIDLAVKASSLEDLHNILKLNPRLDWKRHVQFLAYKYGLANSTMAIDFFGLGKIGTKWHLVNPSGNEIGSQLGPTYYMEDVEMESVRPCRFWDLTLQCPSGELSFLRRLYGEKVLSNAGVWNHGGGKYRAIDMEAEDLNQHAAYFPAMNRDLLNKLHFGEKP